MSIVDGLMDDNYSLSYVDYRESLDNSLDTIEKCLEAKNSDALHEKLDEWYSQQEYESVYNIMEDLKKELVKSGYKNGKQKNSLRE